jgi:hypothetical protein
MILGGNKSDRQDNKAYACELRQNLCGLTQKSDRLAVTRFNVSCNAVKMKINVENVFTKWTFLWFRRTVPLVV